MDREDLLAEILGKYIDRLNAGEEIADEELLRNHPDMGPELVEELRMFRKMAAGNQDGPRTLGEYSLVRTIGRGGMGVVYEAWEASMERRVAVKVLPPAVAHDGKAFSRFLREARIAGQLHHPNIVGVFGVGIKDEIPHAMEYVEGMTIADILGRIRSGDAASDLPVRLLPSGEISRESCYFLAEAFAGAAEGLHHAHRRKVIHRDIKPSNLILDTEADRGAGAKGRLRILDFGLARLEGGESLTGSADLLGTCSYMSPEQAQARKVPIDHRTDIFSLGSTLYETLTLEAPFRGRSPEETLSRIISGEPRPPASINPAVPRDLETIVLKCMAKSPEDRYATAEALAQDLRRCVAGDPIEARRGSALQAWWRRAWRVRRSIAGIALLAALIAALAFLGLAHLDARRARRTEDYRAKVLAAAGRIDLAAIAWETDRSRTGSAPSDLTGLEGTARELEVAEALAPGRPDAPYHRARALLYLGRAKESLEALARLRARFPGFVPAAVLEAQVLRKRWKADDAERILADASKAARSDLAREWLEALRCATEGRHEEAALRYGKLIAPRPLQEDVLPLGLGGAAHLGRAKARLALGDPAGALEDLVRAEDRSPGLLEAALLRGKALYNLGQKDGAEAVFQDVHRAGPFRDEAALAVGAMYRSVGDVGRQLEWADRLQVEGARDFRRMEIYWDCGEYAKAEEAGRRALWEDPENGSLIERFGRLLLDLGRVREATEIAVEAARRLPDRAEIRLRAGFILSVYWGFHGEGMRHLEAALGQDQSALGFSGYCLSFQERIAEALELHRRQTAIDPADGHFSMGANLCGILGRFEEALEEYDRFLELLPDGRVECSRARCLQALGRTEGAVEGYRRALKCPPIRKGTRTWLSTALEVLSRIDEAFRECLAEIEESPDFRWPHERAAALLQGAGGRIPAGDVDLLVGVLDERIRQEEAEPFVVSSLALALLRHPAKPDPRRAEAVLRQALPRWGGDPDLLSALAEIQWAAGNRAAVVRALEEAERGAPGDSRLALRLGDRRRLLFPGLASPASIDAALSRGDPEDLIPAGAVWRSFRGETPEPGWMLPDEDDGPWTETTGPPAGTEISRLPPDRHVRRVFHVSDPLGFRRLVLEMPTGEGMAIYLNGIEVGDPKVKGMSLDSHHRLDDPIAQDEISIDPVLLRPGANLLALRAPILPAGAGFPALPVLRGEVAPGPGMARRLLAAGEAGGVEAVPGALAYLEGRALEEEGEGRRAAERFEEAAEAWPDDAEPQLGRARALRDAGHPGEGASVLRRALARFPGDRRLWEDWLAVSFLDLGRSPADVLQDLAAGSGEGRTAADYRRLLEILASGRPLRIDCAGEGDGDRWVSDMLYTTGTRPRDRPAVEMPFPYPGEIRGTSDPDIYRVQRTFLTILADGRLCGYRIPLPGGTYRVSLHFAEICYSYPGLRNFDVVLEGRTVAEGIEPFAAGPATASVRSWELPVEDGLLEIGFRPRKELAMVAAVEVERVR